MASDSIIAPLARRLAAQGRPLSASEAKVLSKAVVQVSDFRRGSEIVREHDRKDESNLLIEGWACRYNGLPDGRRQMTALHIAGDFIDLHSFTLKVMDHSVHALTPCVVAAVTHDALARIVEQHPSVTRTLWFTTTSDAAVMRQWTARIARRTALENTAHLLCELHTRLAAVGLAEGEAFELPLNQSHLGEALGLSAVHTNRVLQELRSRGLVEVRRSSAIITDRPGLERLALFDPTYLYFRDHSQG